MENRHKLDQSQDFESHYLIDKTSIVVNHQMDIFSNSVSHRPLLQLAHSHVAAGLLPLYSAHLPTATHPQHGDPGGETCRRAGKDIPTFSPQLGPCRYRPVAVRDSGAVCFVQSVYQGCVFAIGMSYSLSPL